PHEGLAHQLGSPHATRSRIGLRGLVRVAGAGHPLPVTRTPNGPFGTPLRAFLFYWATGPALRLPPEGAWQSIRHGSDHGALGCQERLRGLGSDFGVPAGQWGD